MTEKKSLLDEIIGAVTKKGNRGDLNRMFLVPIKEEDVAKAEAAARVPGASEETIERAIYLKRWRSFQEVKDQKINASNGGEW